MRDVSQFLGCIGGSFFDKKVYVVSKLAKSPASSPAESALAERSHTGFTETAVSVAFIVHIRSFFIVFSGKTRILMKKAINLIEKKCFAEF